MEPFYVGVYTELNEVMTNAGKCDGVTGSNNKTRDVNFAKVLT